MKLKQTLCFIAGFLQGKKQLDEEETEILRGLVTYVTDKEMSSQNPPIKLGETK